MQVSVETTGNVERRITVGIPKERIEPEIKNRLKTLARKAKLNGFRPGKVPLRVIEQKYGPQVRQEVLGEVVQASFYEAVEQEKLRPVGEPNFDFKSDLKNLEEGVSYTATFEIYPELSTIHIEGLVVEKPVAHVTESDVDTMLYRLRQHRQTWNEVNRAAIEKDRVVLDGVATVNGNPFEDNEFKQLPVILGQNNFILPGLEEGLIGVCAGEDRELDLTFPTEYPNPDLASRIVHIAVHVISVAEPQLPEMDAEFARSLGVEDGNIDTLRVDARNNMERELEYAIKGKVKQQVLDALLKINPLEVPQSLVDEEAQRLLKYRQREVTNPQLTTDMFREEALVRVKLGILVSELVKIHEIQVSAEKVRQLIERIAMTYEEPDRVIKGYYADKQRLKEVESMVLEEQVVEWLLEKAQIIEKETDFYSLLEQNQLSQRQVVNG